MVVYNHSLGIKPGKTIITVPHGPRGNFINFQHPIIRNDHLKTLDEQLKEEGLIFPTPAEAASLFYSVFMEPYEFYTNEVKEELDMGYFYTDAKIKYTPGRGAVIITGDSEIVVPFGFKSKDTSKPFEFKKHPLIEGLFGEQGASKMSTVIDLCQQSSFVSCWGYDDTEITGNVSFSRHNYRDKTFIVDCNSSYNETPFTLGVIGNK